MQLSIHYYVLSLAERVCRLFEGFRDTLIDIQNKAFPINASYDALDPAEPASDENRLRAFFLETDRHLAHYEKQDPLRLVVVGEKNCLSIFHSITAHRDLCIGTVEGDHVATSPCDLGKIVWPIVKEAMAGVSEKAMHGLETAANERKVASGIDAVALSMESGAGSTLFVEEDYHVKGGILKSNNSMVVCSDVDIREVIDDAVDAIIDTVLEKGGNVVFLNGGSLIKFQRIALLLPG